MIHQQSLQCQVKRYFERFDRSQIKVYLYEDFNNNPTFLLKDIFQFLNVDETFIPDIRTRYNVTGIPRSRKLHEFLKFKNKKFIKEFFRLLLPYELNKRILSSLRQLNLPKPVLSQDLRSQLIEVYREDILKLQDLINRDLSKWLN